MNKQNLRLETVIYEYEVTFSLENKVVEPDASFPVLLHKLILHKLILWDFENSSQSESDFHYLSIPFSLLAADTVQNARHCKENNPKTACKWKPEKSSTSHRNVLTVAVHTYVPHPLSDVCWLYATTLR